ncbi:uncharacterized protein LOC125946534 [Dermacentor silvarum]|uniref:uncharacterized protein LOC125946534 n=1 Tax=Dermacentor silvarum TaxID=543639 RepID=UPI002101C886|nr:uncharacterized protein LOC125946534 [Dermacentor silvarum]
MDCKQYFSALAFLALVEILKSETAYYGKVDIRTPDIKKFVGVNEPIWTYKATGTTRVECKMDMMQSITNESIIFKRMYTYADQTFSDVLEGKFKKKYKDKMFIQKKRAPFYQLEQMIYRPRNAKCAVIMITLISHVLQIPPLRWYELWVRNSAIGEPIHPNCTTQFDELRLQERLVYTDDCQTRLSDLARNRAE